MNDSIAWEEIQSEICEKLLFLGAEIRQYDLGKDDMRGAYLLCRLNDLRLMIDFEDATTYESCVENEVYDLTIFKRCDEGFTRPLTLHGFVKTIQDAEQVFNYLRDGRFEEAMKLFYRDNYHGEEPRTEGQIVGLIEKGVALLNATN